MPDDRIYSGAENRMGFKMILLRCFHPIVAATLCGLCLVFMGPGGEVRSAEGVLVDRIVAQVNDDIITVKFPFPRIEPNLTTNIFRSAFF